MTLESLLRVHGLSCPTPTGERIISNISFQLDVGDILVISGKSGAGKSTLLKALCHLNPYDGTVLLEGQKPSDLGIPSYRTRVLYVPQRPSLLPSTPRVFLDAVKQFGSRRARQGGDTHGVLRLAASWGIAEETWDREFSSLSGGEAQRVALAVAVGLGGVEVLILDEPTSALDEETSLQIERDLVEMVKTRRIKGVIWVTHSAEQSKRVGTRWMSLRDGVGREDNGR